MFHCQNNLSALLFLHHLMWLLLFSRLPRCLFLRCHTHQEVAFPMIFSSLSYRLKLCLHYIIEELLDFYISQATSADNGLLIHQDYYNQVRIPQNTSGLTECIKICKYSITFYLTRIFDTLDMIWICIHAHNLLS